MVQYYSIVLKRTFGDISFNKLIFPHIYVYYTGPYISICPYDRKDPKIATHYPH